jgi:hypothetical protein
MGQDKSGGHSSYKEMRNEIQFIVKKTMLTIHIVPGKEHRAPSNVNDTVHVCMIVDIFPCTSSYAHDC